MTFQQRLGDVVFCDIARCLYLVRYESFILCLCSKVLVTRAWKFAISGLAPLRPLLALTIVLGKRAERLLITLLNTQGTTIGNCMICFVIISWICFPSIIFMKHS